LKTRDDSSVSTITTSSYQRDEIDNALVESAFDNGQRFLPAHSLERLVTSENIREQLAYWDAGDEEIQSLVDFVLDEARKIFVIIVYIDRIDVGDALESLRKSGVTDRHLPIPRELIECGRMKGRSVGKECRHDRALGVFHKKPWRRVAVSDFYHSQWKFLAPVFTPDHEEIVLDMRAVLPLVHVGRDARMGFFSEVYEVELHRDHHRGIAPLEDGHDLRVALKELRMDSRDGELRSIFEQETESLKALRKFRHEHMITAIASIVRGERRYFLFPWADGMDLRAFWMANEFWPLTPNLIQEAVQQLEGLAGALDTLHEQGWRHGDVKPENILRFKNETTLGHLKLGDLGLARTHTVKTQLRSYGTMTRVGTMRYEPPETVTSSSLPRSRKYDIWSMGCVIMEFVVWLLYGPTGLNEFSQALSQGGTFGEAFYSTRQGDGGKLQGEVHPVVKFWLHELSKNPDWPRDSVIVDLVELVATHLLVVRTSFALPMVEQPSSEQSSIPLITIATGSELKLSNVRADANMLQEQLSRIRGRCLTEPDYLFPRAARAALYRRAIPEYQSPRAILVRSLLGDDLKPSALRDPVPAVPEQLTQLLRAPKVEDYDDKQIKDLGVSYCPLHVKGLGS
jgi:serine/threonine protein kinase